MTKTQHQYFRADIPRDQPDLAFLVHKLQKSDKRSPCLTIQNEPSFFTLEGGKYLHHLKHPAEEFALKLRGYIATLIPALKCSMDYQTTDGVAMLLRYVTSYVTKSHDSTVIDSMYSYEVQGRQAALRYLMSDQPAEPGMWSFLFSKKVAWSASRTKPFTVPTSQNVSENKTVLKYWKRDNKFDSLSMLQWLRLLDTNKAEPKPYKHGSTLVGTKTVSVFNPEFFFQYVLLQHPHRHFKDLYHPEHENLPYQIRWYATAVSYFPHFWQDKEMVLSFFVTQGHQDSYITTIISYIASLQDLLYLIKIEVLKKEQIANVQACLQNDFSLDTYQLAVTKHIEKAILLRQTFYSNMRGGNVLDDDSCIDNYTDDESDNESDSDEDYNQSQVLSNDRDMSTIFDSDIVWQKPILVLGKTGAGKTQALCQAINKHVQSGANSELKLQTFSRRRQRQLSVWTGTSVTAHGNYRSLAVDVATRT